MTGNRLDTLPALHTDRIPGRPSERDQPNPRAWMRALFAVITLSINFAGHAANAPNVVIVLVDDLGWNDVGYHGSEIETPRIDALAKEALVLRQYHAQPTCSPTRAALMTGRSPLRLGVVRPIAKISTTGLPLSERTLGERFQQAGYQTFLTGKWHLGYAEPEYHPNARGFDHFYGHVTGGIGYWDHVHGGGLDWQRNGKTVREDGYSTHLIADEAIRLIRQRETERPMLLYASFNAPHLPNEAPDATIERYAHIANPSRRVHAAMVTELDTAVGRLVDALEDEGMLENTIIWFMSDNGGLNRAAAGEGLLDFALRIEDWFGKPAPLTFLEFLRVNTLDGGADNSPLRSGKMSVYEGGTRVPSFVYWPNNLPAREITPLVTVQDVLPTLLEATGLAATGNESDGEFDGASQWPLFKGQADTVAPDYVISGMDGEALYRWPWKLIASTEGTHELFNLEQDPEETAEVSAGEPRVVAELAAALSAMPRGDSIHVPLYKVVWDPDFFGGEEDRLPWADAVRAR